MLITIWKVFETIEDKKNHNGYLWTFHNDETVVYKIHPTRSSDALIEHFGENYTGGTLNVDRYGAYKGTPIQIRSAIPRLSHNLLSTSNGVL